MSKHFQIHTTKALRMHHSLSTFNQVTTVMQYYSKNHTMVNLQKFSLRLIKSPLKRAQGNVSVIYMQGQTYLKSIMKCIHKCLFEVLPGICFDLFKKNAALPTYYVQTCKTWILWNWASRLSRYERKTYHQMYWLKTLCLTRVTCS